MMQNVVVAIMVFGAVVYIVRKYIWRSKNQNNACGACHGCAGKKDCASSERQN